MERQHTSPQQSLGAIKLLMRWGLFYLNGKIYIKLTKNADKDAMISLLSYRQAGNI